MKRPAADCFRLSCVRIGLLPLALLVSLLVGCSTPYHNASVNSRRFDFPKDTFAFANELVWEYGFDHHGEWTSQRREPSPDYSLRCFVLARSAAQFFQSAHFEPTLPVAEDAVYRRLIRQVVRRSLRSPRPDSERIVIPGYSDLRSFSEAREQLLKDECGGFRHSYFQRGNWRMIFPFSRAHQARTLERLGQEVEKKSLAVVHLVRFPQLSINHAVVIFAARPTPTGAALLAYDPNDPERPLRLNFHSATASFLLDPTGYFPGGRVDVYQVYHRWNY